MQTCIFSVYRYRYRRFLANSVFSVFLVQKKQIQTSGQIQIQKQIQKKIICIFCIFFHTIIHEFLSKFSQNFQIFSPNFQFFVKFYPKFSIFFTCGANFSHLFPLGLISKNFPACGAIFSSLFYRDVTLFSCYVPTFL